MKIIPKLFAFALILLLVLSCGSDAIAAIKRTGFNLIIAEAENGSVSVESAAGQPLENYSQLDADSEIKLTAEADDGYILESWNINRENAGSDSPMIISMDQNKKVAAVFRAIDSSLSYGLTLSDSENGAVGAVFADDSAIDDMTAITEGSRIKLTAAAYFGYRFDKWLINGQNSGGDNPLTVVIGGDKEAQAVFVPLITGDPQLTFEYASSDEDIATVDADGNVTLGRKRGTATITVTVKMAGSADHTYDYPVYNAGVADWTVQPTARNGVQTNYLVVERGVTDISCETRYYYILDNSNISLPAEEERHLDSAWLAAGFTRYSDDQLDTGFIYPGSDGVFAVYGVAVSGDNATVSDKQLTPNLYT